MSTESEAQPAAPGSGSLTWSSTGRMPPTPERVAEIRERAEKASPGPWRSYIAGSEGAHIWPDTGDKHNDVRRLGTMNGRDLAQDGLNAAFTAHARTDIPELLEWVDSLTQQRDEAQAQARSLRNDRDWFEGTSRKSAATIARVEALWADNAIPDSDGGRYVPPEELRAAIDGPALAVTAPPETPTETWTQLTERQFKELTEAGHTTECQRVMSVGDMPLYPCDCPASANCVHYLKVDETEHVSYCIHCGAIDPPETPGEKLLRDIFTDETQRSLWQVKLISTGVLLTLPKKMAETQALADALEAAGHDIELVRAVPATPEEDRP